MVLLSGEAPQMIVKMMMMMKKKVERERRDWCEGVNMLVCFVKLLFSVDVAT